LFSELSYGGVCTINSDLKLILGDGHFLCRRG
jgi:hypothetical protein